MSCTNDDDGMWSLFWNENERGPMALLQTYGGIILNSLRRRVSLKWCRFKPGVYISKDTDNQVEDELLRESRFELACRNVFLRSDDDCHLGIFLSIH